MKLLKNLQCGDEVYFTDPDEDFSSGIYVVQTVLCDPGEEHSDTVVCLRNEAGSNLEAFLSELK